MLRIEKMGEDAATVILKLEGRIIGQWVAALEEECERVLRGPKRLVLDVAEVTFIDRDGVATLGKIKDERMQLVNCSPFLRELLRWAQRP